MSAQELQIWVIDQETGERELLYSYGYASPESLFRTWGSGYYNYVIPRAVQQVVRVWARRNGVPKAAMRMLGIWR